MFSAPQQDLGKGLEKQPIRPSAKMPLTVTSPLEFHAI